MRTQVVQHLNKTVRMCEGAGGPTTNRQTWPRKRAQGQKETKKDEGEMERQVESLLLNSAINMYWRACALRIQQQ